MGMIDKCEGCGAPVQRTLCCPSCIQRIRQMRGEKVERFAVTFVVLAGNVDEAGEIARQIMGEHMRDGLDYSIRVITAVGDQAERLEPMNVDAHL